MSRGSSPFKSGPNSSLIIVVSAWFCAMPPTCALASPQPVMPHSVSMRTIVPSNDSVLPKSLTCWRSGGMGICTQCASTDLIFIAISATPIAIYVSLPCFEAKVKQIVVLGAGFAGLIAAVGAARKLAELKIDKSDVAVTVVNRDEWHSIRVRNYETELGDTRVPLDDVLGPIGVDLKIGEVTGIDCDRHEIALAGQPSLRYDRLIFALGSELVRPPIPGLAEHGFDIDTHDAALRLGAHLAALPARPASPGRFTALIVGGGLTGVEMATELATRLNDIAGNAPTRVILADRTARIGSNMGDPACDVIDEALTALEVKTRPGVTIAAIDSRGARLASGETIAAETIIWCGGMRAHPLAAALPGEHDHFGRVTVDRFMKLDGCADIFATGDAAMALVD